MIRLELGDFNELMQLYQCIMAGKFSAENSELLESEPLARAANRIVDTIMAEARLTHNEGLVETLENSRYLQENYPQFIEIQSCLKNINDWNVLESSEKTRRLKVMAAPLLLSEEIIKILLGESS